jgi:hypothetical protein
MGDHPPEIMYQPLTCVGEIDCVGVDHYNGQVAKFSLVFTWSDRCKLHQCYFVRVLFICVKWGWSCFSCFFSLEEVATHPHFGAA